MKASTCMRKALYTGLEEGITGLPHDRGHKRAGELIIRSGIFKTIQLSLDTQRKRKFPLRCGETWKRGWGGGEGEKGEHA